MIRKIIAFCFFAVIAFSVSGVQYSHLTISGSAVDEDGDMPMNALNGKYVAYLRLCPGTFTLKGTDVRGRDVTLGLDSGSAVVNGGEPVTVTEAGIAKVVYDAGTERLDIQSLNSLGLRGSVVPDNTYLEYAGHGAWSATVTLDRQTSDQYINRNFCFIFNDDDNSAVRRLPGTYNVVAPEHNVSGENIRINTGTYRITLDMSAYTYAIESPVDDMRISVFGSSVANGQGAENMHGYAYLFGEQLKSRYAQGVSPNALYTSGVSIGGNTTTDLHNRYPDVLNDFGRYVIIGLSLGNEGIHESANPEATFNRFADNMLSLIEKLRADGKFPVVVNNYTRGDYNEADYGYVRRMNMLIHGWDVPSVNSLGAIDDGTGKWAQGYIADVAHPNTQGHKEFMYAFVPSLFDAVIAEKPLPVRDMSQQMTLGEGALLGIAPEGTLHPFTLCMRVKGSDPGRLLAFEHSSGRLNGTGSVSVNADGTVTYSSPRSGAITTPADVMGDGEWHDIAISHYYARAYTVLYVDGMAVGGVSENIQLKGDFVIGDNTPGCSPRSYAEISLWRAGMNQDEMTAHHNGDMLKSSLEIYSPMVFDGSKRIPNLAQSLNEIKAGEKASVNTAVYPLPSLRIESGVGHAVFYGDNQLHDIYSTDGRCVASVRAVSSGTCVALAPGIYISAQNRFVVK